jgi:acyl-CoA synthetase (AMP-forming)/AMP-acid ligase II
MHTPYGATECLPVATIEAAEVLQETAAKTDRGDGICVGRKFESIDWRIIRITDDPIPAIGDAEKLPAGEIGELVVRGPQVSPAYVTRTEANATAKIAASQSPIRNPQSKIGPWHRVGDVGCLDAENRFWYCGRKSHRVETSFGPLFTEQIEPIFNTLATVRRCALVGIGPRGQQIPVVVVEPCDWKKCEALAHEITNFANSQGATRSIERFLFYPSLPVDIRHNSKINREWLTEWAAKQLTARPHRS